MTGAGRYEIWMHREPKTGGAMLIRKADMNDEELEALKDVGYSFEDRYVAADEEDAKRWFVRWCRKFSGDDDITVREMSLNVRRIV